LDQPDRNRLWIAAAISLAERKETRAVPALIKVLDAGVASSFLHEPAMVALGAIGDPQAISALLRLLTDPNPHVRAVAARSLGSAGVADRQVETALRAATKDEEEIVRQAASHALAQMAATQPGANRP